MTKRLFAVLAIGAALACALVGCKPDDTNTTTPAPTTDVKKDAPTPEATTPPTTTPNTPANTKDAKDAKDATPAPKDEKPKTN